VQVFRERKASGAPGFVDVAIVVVMVVAKRTCARPGEASAAREDASSPMKWQLSV